MKQYRIAVIEGDGIGPEIIRQAIRALDAAAGKFGFGLEYEYLLAGGAAIDDCGEPLPERTLAVCREADSVLLGAVGGAKWDAQPPEKRPERALLGLRKGLGLYTNLRPAIVYPALLEASPLKAEIIGQGLDLLIVRELTGGIYFGEHGTKTGPDGRVAFDVEQYSEMEVRRIGQVAFDLAAKRSRRVCSVDKANVLESSRLWRSVMRELAAGYPAVAYSELYVDNAAMQLVRDPGQFDVLVTSNMFGDILSDEASQITGSIGMLPSASLGDGGRGMYEPIHGSAPDIAGQHIANPVAAIASAAMLLRYSLGEGAAADAVEAAIRAALDDGCRTADIAAGGEKLSTEEMGGQIAARI